MIFILHFLSFFWWVSDLAEEDVHRDIDGLVSKLFVAQDKLVFLGGHTDNGVGAPLPLGNLLEDLDLVGLDGEHVAFLFSTTKQET